MTARRHPRLRTLAGTLNLISLIFMLLPIGAYLGARSDREQLRVMAMLTPPAEGTRHLPPVTIPTDSSGSFFGETAYFQSPRLAVIHLDTDHTELIVDGVTQYSSTNQKRVLAAFAAWHEEQRRNDTLVFSSLRTEGKTTFGAYITALDQLLHVDGIHFCYCDSIPIARARLLAHQLHTAIDRRRHRGPSSKVHPFPPTVKARRPSFDLSRELSLPQPLQSIVDVLNRLPATETFDSVLPDDMIQY
jgi:hypothetical protein